MTTKTSAIAIRLLGFPPKEEETFRNVLAVAREKGYRYTCLLPGSIQDPDMYIVNAGNLPAMALLSDLHPGEAQPVLLIGKTELEFDFPVMPRPIRWRKILDVLDDIIDKRQLLLTTLSAQTVLSVHERRKHPRLDLDLTDPDVYQRMRKQPLARGGILIVDKDTQFREYVASIMDPYGIPVTLANDERSALLLDGNNQHALTFINTSTQGVDPYRLCDGLKRQNQGLKSAVVLLVDRHFEYKPELGQKVRCEGFLTKPISRKVILKTMKKYLYLDH